MNTKKKIAIITGASSGLGKEFARQMEKKFFLDEIWLIARRTDPMKEVAEGFMKSKGVAIACDLTNEGDVLALIKRIQDENAEVQFLVNNAGYGKIGPFREMGMDEQIKMIDLNIRTLTRLTHACLHHMKEGGAVIQVASSIAFCPAPYFAVYAATKSFVLSLSEALNYELKKNGIHVMAVCPGPVSTEFFQVAQINEYMKDKVGQAEPFNKALMARPQDVVEKALTDLKRRRKLSIYGAPIRFFTSVIPFVPNFLAMKIVAKRNQ